MSFDSELIETYKNLGITEIVGKWKLSRLKDVTQRVKVGFVGSCEKFYCDKENGISMIRTTNLKENGLDLSDIKYVTKEFHQKNLKSQLKKGDILVARHGENGKACIYKEDYEANCLNVVVIEPDEKKLNSLVLKYLFDSSIIKNQILMTLVGSVQNVVNTKSIAELIIPVPSYKEQQTIASILSTLDEKIELNNKMNKLLEQMAQAVFKQWFVDFDFPNENGDPYKSSGGEMEWCEELGKEIPKGWHVRNISEIIEINPKRVLKKGIEAVYVEMKNLPAFSARVTGWTIREFTSGSKFINGDVLMARITPCLENGKTVFVDFLNGSEVGWGSTEFIVLRSKHKVPLEFAYFLARSDEFRNHAISNMSGSSGRQRVPESCFDFYHICEPPTNILDQFGGIASSFLLKVKRNGEEVKVLSQIRDSLLPKLMSGEIDVSQVEI